MMTYSKADQALIARITIMATSNLRLLAMPAEALLMWQRMMMLIVQYGTGGVLSYGGIGRRVFDACRHRVTHERNPAGNLARNLGAKPEHNLGPAGANDRLST